MWWPKAFYIFVLFQFSLGIFSAVFLLSFSFFIILCFHVCSILGMFMFVFFLISVFYFFMRGKVNQRCLALFDFLRENIFSLVYANLTWPGTASSEGVCLLCIIDFNWPAFDAAECQDFFTQNNVRHSTSSTHAQPDFFEKYLCFRRPSNKAKVKSKKNCSIYWLMFCFLFFKSKMILYNTCKLQKVICNNSI